MKIAIIGSGFFGITLGLILSKKHNVDVYEKENKILCGASSANQLRFHFGYHYPRSQKTILEIVKLLQLIASLYYFVCFRNYHLLPVAHSAIKNPHRTHWLIIIH